MNDVQERPSGTLMGRSELTERLQAWQCIGCGKIEAPQNCIGVCQDRKVDFVYADEYDNAIAKLELARQQVRAVTALVRQLAHTTPPVLQTAGGPSTTQRPPGQSALLRHPPAGYTQ